jgi:multiple sugar transport system ATP-binding protein
VAAPAATVTIGVRTEHLRVRRDPAGSGRVARIEHLGDQTHLHVTLADATVVVLADPDVPLEVGDAVTLQLENPLFFGADGNRLRH